jgi:hypothetical protein
VTIEGVDYAWSRPDPAGLYAAGKRFASRYLSYDKTGKNLTAAEAEQLAAAGIAVVCNWEWRAGDAKGGFAAGAEYAAEALRQAAACGMSAGRPIYFSVDYDPAGSYGPVDAYFRGIASVLPIAQIGAYGGYGTIDHLLGAGLIRWAWQTYAWSGGQWHHGTHVQQYRNGVEVAGGDVDLNRAMVEDFGQWTPGGSMALTEKDVTDIWQHYLAPEGYNMHDHLLVAEQAAQDAKAGVIALEAKVDQILALLQGGVTVNAKVDLTDEAVAKVADATADEIAADPERDGHDT